MKLDIYKMKTIISKPKFTTGFTLIELLLIVAVVAIVFAFSAPYTTKFYVSNSVSDTQSNLINTIERARHYAILQKNDSNFGVHISVASSSYTLFQGNSYNTRDQSQDEVFPVNGNIIFSTTTDIIFSKLTGLPNATGTVSLTYGNYSQGILISDSGGVSRVSVSSQGSSGCQITSTVTPVNSVYTFTSNGTFEVVSGTCNVAALVVGAGGGGESAGHSGGGGGGGGEVISTSSLALTTNSYPVVVGTGVSGASGNPSTFNGITADGGLFGHTNGGSGGASGNGYSGGTGGVPGQCGNRSGGGGGGASAVGGNHSGAVPGNGGDGIPSDISGTTVYYGGGGGGGRETGTPGSNGGNGGGGAGGLNTLRTAGENGVANTGGGGGGEGGVCAVVSGSPSAGGSGVVIIKVLN